MKRILSITLLIVSVLFSKSFAQGKRIETKGFAVFSGDGQFKPYEFTRHAIGNNDIEIKSLYAGDECQH